MLVDDYSKKEIAAKTQHGRATISRKVKRVREFLRGHFPHV
jgi:predicted DNA-binding protein YlxM (UPF0122 family)